MRYIIFLLFTSLLLAGCDDSHQAENEQLTQALVNKSLANMIPVKGGDFLMGDFGPLVGEKMPLSINSDDKKLHKVILDDFMISKYKVTNEDFNMYIKITNKENLPLGLGAQFPKLLKTIYQLVSLGRWLKIIAYG